MGYKEDVRCSSGEPYSCLNCSANYLPCSGDCKQFKKKSEINIAGKGKWLNCCSYCIKTRSCAKVENEYLKSIRYNGPHYLKTGKKCVVDIENKFLKDENNKKKALKQACDKFKSITQTQKKLEKEQLVEIQDTGQRRKCDDTVEKREKKCEEVRAMATEMRQKKEYKKKLQNLEKKCKKQEKKMEKAIEKTVKKQNRECNQKKQEMDKLEKKQYKVDKKKQQMIEKIQKKLEKEDKQQKKKIPTMQEENVNPCEEYTSGYYKKFEKNLQNCKTKKEAKKILPNTDYKLVKETNDDTKGKIKDACHSGICANYATNKKVKFICKCKKRRLFTPQCKNTTCVGVIPSPIEGTLNKLSCICKKVSMNLLGKHHVCEGGQCQRAKNCNRDFLCKCLPQVTCVTSTCGKNTKFKEVAQVAHAKCKRKCKCGLKYKKIILQDQIDQTGEPAFDVQVRRGGLEVANLEEVQQNVKNLGKTRILCACPTVNKHLQHSIKNVCATGACRSALRSKSISITCKCESRKSRFCKEKTCDLKANLNPLARSSSIIDPLFSLNVNTDKNTILNSDEIQKRISNYQNKHKFCEIGRCHDAFNKREMDFTCECRPMSDICTDKTCDLSICVKEVDKKNKLESKKHKGESNCRIEHRPMQGVSGVSAVVRKKEDPWRSRSAGIAHFCCKQEKQINKTLNSAGDGAYCCGMCQESNPTTNKEQNEKYLAKQNKKKELEIWENEEKIRIENNMMQGNVSLISSGLSGLVSWIVAIISKLIRILYSCVRHPKLAFAYTQEKLRNPKPTLYMIKRWGFQLYRSKLLRIKYNIARSETATMLTDEILTSKYVKVFLPKDKATNDNLTMRQQRKMKRKKDAIYSCKHVQLLTMRKTPCMWFFYLCPEFYLQFLNFVTGCKTALKVIGAIVVWTPCIVVVEIINCCCCC